MKLSEIYSNKPIYLNMEDIRAQWIDEKQGTQKEKIQLLRKICAKENIINFYDLGANYGEFSVGMSDIVTNVYSFEPNPLVFDSLEKTSDLYDNISCYKKAVSTEDKNATFYFNTKYSGGGKLFKKWAWNDSRYQQFNTDKYFKEQEVECVDFLNFLEKTNNQEKCLIKIDIEGLELDIIYHIQSYLKTLEKWYIFFESDKVNLAHAERSLPGMMLITSQSDTLIGVI